MNSYALQYEELVFYIVLLDNAPPILQLLVLACRGPLGRG